MSMIRLIQRAGALACLGMFSLLSSTGCFLHDLGVLPPPVPPSSGEGFELRGDDLEAVEPPKPGTPEAMLAGAHELLRRGKYSDAKLLFHTVADAKQIPATLTQEAIYYEAECLRLQGKYPSAADTYSKLLRDFPNTRYREQTLKHAFEIANYWLDDTRTAMKEAEEVAAGKRWFKTPRFFHIDSSKPFADEEGRAVQLLEQVHLGDIAGDRGLGDRALFLAGGVEFFQGDYEEADHFFTQIHERHPNSPYAAKALEYAVLSKNFGTGGPDYDGRKVAEARLLVLSAMRNYPELARNKKGFLVDQLAALDSQQASKEYEQARFYERRGKRGSAYWCYHVVQRRYPKTKYAKMAAERVAALEAKYGPFERPAASATAVELGKPGTVTPGEPLEPVRQPVRLEPPPPPRPAAPGSE